MKKEATTYHNPKFYPFGDLKERVERDDIKLWEGKPDYQDKMAERIEGMNKGGEGLETSRTAERHDKVGETIAIPRPTIRHIVKCSHRFLDNKGGEGGR